MAHTNLLLTGPSGVGKSTLLKILGRSVPGMTVRGFFGDSVWENGVRMGWRLESFGGDGGILADTTIQSPQRMGRYGVDMALFNRIVAEELRLSNQAGLYLLDEIGIVSAWCPGFEEVVNALFDSPKLVVAVVRQKGEGFNQEVMRRPDVETWTVTPENRERLLGCAIEWVATTGQSLNWLCRG